MTTTEFIDPNLSSDASSDPSAMPPPPALDPPVAAVPPTPKFRLVRSRTDRKLGGVCGGLAAAFDIDVTLVRILVVGAAFAGFGIPIYLAAWILAPYDDAVR